MHSLLCSSDKKVFLSLVGVHGHRVIAHACGAPFHSLPTTMASSYQENEDLVSHMQTFPHYGKLGNESPSPTLSRRRGFFSFRAAGLLILLLLSVVLFYHALILTQVVPYENVWGGKLTSLEQMYRLEAISVAANVLIVAVAILRLVLQDNKCLSAFCWIFCVLYALNTVGNILAETKFERFVFTPVTLLLSISFARLATGTKQGDAD